MKSPAYQIIRGDNPIINSDNRGDQSALDNFYHGPAHLSLRNQAYFIFKMHIIYHQNCFPGVHTTMKKNTVLLGSGEAGRVT
jgi:hypothetical protein